MSRTVTIMGYAALALGAIGLQVVARLSTRVPGLGDALGCALQSRLGRAGLLAGWLWLGWHLFVRVHR